MPFLPSARHGRPAQGQQAHRGGFSDQEILDLGPDVRNTLASSGAAMIRIGDKVEALFALDGNFLHVSTRTRGSFIYDVGKKAFL
jgi:hypothetical protein